MANGLKGPAAHHEDISQRHFAKEAEILRQMPGDFAGATNHAVFAHRGDGLKVSHEPWGVCGGPAHAVKILKVDTTSNHEA
jgi:hypothetical protein